MAEQVREQANQDYPYMESGPRDELVSVGVSEHNSVHPDNQRTTYVRDYKAKRVVTDTLDRTNFRAGRTDRYEAPSTISEARSEAQSNVTASQPYYA